MSIFKTEVPKDICLSTDQVVSAVIDPTSVVRRPLMLRTSEQDVQNTKPGAVRRKSGDK